MAFMRAPGVSDEQFPVLLVVHDFEARSPDELSLKKGDRIDLIEKDDDFGDGWYLGRHRTNGKTGLFPEVYTTTVPRPHPPANVLPTTNGRPSTRISQGLDNALRSVSVGNPSRYGTDNVAPLPLNTASSGQSTGGMTSPVLPSPISPNAGIGRAFSMGAALSHSHNQDSPVMNETLSVIDEHITDMGTPRHSLVAPEHRDSGSEYSGHHEQHRVSYIPGHETDEEDEQQHTRKEVLTWDPAQVAEYLQACGVEGKQCEVLREQEINGQVLLDLDRSTLLMPEFDLGKLGPRLYLWQKIRALQAEVGDAGHSRQSSINVPAQDEQPPRDRSGTDRSALQNAIQGMESASRAARSSLQKRDGQSSPSHSPLPLNMARISPTVSSRPSAASIRDLNHSRRHSSADFGPAGAPTSARDGREPLPRSNTQSHRKGGSFDRGWTLSAAAGAAIGRPNSSEAGAIGQVPSQKTPTSVASTAEDALTSTTQSIENDRGYFSGGEVENRKSRNVLRKRDTLQRSPNPSYADEQRRRSATASIRQSRVGSADQALEAAGGSSSKTSMLSGSTLFRGSSLREAKAALTASPLYQKTLASPAVTKLEYDQSNSGTASPKSNQSSAVGSPNPQSPTKAVGPASKVRSLGLRAISDAVTSGEKAAATRDSPLQSPPGTGASTPNKSIEFENNSAKSSTLQSNGGKASSRGVSRRKKSKKDTSAYRRGLMEKTPQEQMVGCEYSGWMKKKSSKFITLWKPRLFILRGRRLSYYYSENDTKEQGLIDISGYRVMAAGNERVTGLHATLTGATASPASPENATTPTLASQEPTASSANGGTGDASTERERGMFIFKLSPPRPGYAGTNFTQPEEHYFGCDNAAQGRAWMAALTKVTIDLDLSAPMTTTYNQATISLAKAKAMKHRPPALRDVDEDADGESKASSLQESSTPGLTSGPGPSLNSVVIADSESGLGIVLGEDRNESPIEMNPEEGSGAKAVGTATGTDAEEHKESPASRLETNKSEGLDEQPPPPPTTQAQGHGSPVVTGS